LLFAFHEEKSGKYPDKLTFNDMSRDSVTEFCQWLEDARNSSVKTRNLRLTAIHSFFRFVEMRDPSKISLCREILSIPAKKHEKKLPIHISDKEVKMLLAEPDIRTKQGIRDLAIMALLYDSGARVSELTKLKMSDIQLDGTATVRIVGKGRKQRIVPISAPTANIIKAYIKTIRTDASFGERTLFMNKSGGQLTRPGVNYILDKYVQKARINNPGHFNAKVTAHVMRHTKATTLLLSEVSLIYIRDFLGHSSVVTTEVYAKTNPEFLRNAIEKNANNYGDLNNNYGVKEKGQLVEFLKAFRK
jgi:site-specific recombinase XerD